MLRDLLESILDEMKRPPQIEDLPVIATNLNTSVESIEEADRS